MSLSNNNKQIVYTRRTAFTLIELLTVISIIAVLAAILFPVFAQAREKARQGTCLSNLKQVTLAITMYTSDYDELLPLYSYGPGVAGYIGYFGLDGPRWADFINPYVKSNGVFDCPDGNVHLAVYPGGANYDTQTYTYGYSTPSLTTYPDSQYGVAGRSLSELTSVSSTILLADSRIDHGEGSARILPVSYDTPNSLNHKVDGNRHSGARGFDILGKAFLTAYGDGHVKYVSLIDTLGNPPALPDQWSISQ